MANSSRILNLALDSVALKNAFWEKILKSVIATNNGLAARKCDDHDGLVYAG